MFHIHNSQQYALSYIDIIGFIYEATKKSLGLQKIRWRQTSSWKRSEIPNGNTFRVVNYSSLEFAGFQSLSSANNLYSLPFYNV